MKEKSYWKRKGENEKKKHYKRKRKEEQTGHGGRRRKNKKKKTKNKFVHFFLRCSDDRSSVARELNLVYSTRATSKYQEWKVSVLHAPRGRCFSYSSSFLFKGRKWLCGLELVAGLSFWL